MFDDFLSFEFRYLYSPIFINDIKVEVASPEEQQQFLSRDFSYSRFY